jgi:hypothetical protein|tara:strand:+ start:580 stop:972 length:393 start_codon:yes stop_codon:yes gene_type:complete
MSRASDLANVIASGSTNIVAEGTATTNLQQGLIKAWMDLNGSTFGLRDSFNVSSATDNGGGNYTKTLTNNLSAAQAGTSGSACSNTAYSDRECSVIPNATSSLQINTGQDYTTNRADSEFTNTMMSGDLA